MRSTRCLVLVRASAGEPRKRKSCLHAGTSAVRNELLAMVRFPVTRTRVRTFRAPMHTDGRPLFEGVRACGAYARPTDARKTPPPGFRHTPEFRDIPRRPSRATPQLGGKHE